MNLHGYKKHKKGMQRMIDFERTKQYPDQSKISRLQGCIRDCNRRIQAMTEVKHKQGISSSFNHTIKVKPKSKRQASKVNKK